jgi:hypothetical protein
MSHRLTTRIGWIALGMGLLAPLCRGAFADAQALSEYQVKAAYLYSFTKFVEWPEGTFANASDPIRLCVLNDKPFHAQLNQIAGNKQIAGHPVVVVLITDSRQSRGCQELFIGASESQQTSQILDSVRGASVLTVGETDTFVEQGGIINFVVPGDHVQFQVNQKAATQAGLHMSSQLLSVAKRVFK